MLSNVITIRQTRQERELRKKQKENRTKAVGNILVFKVDSPHLRLPEEVGFLTISSYDPETDCFSIGFEGNLYGCATASVLAMLNARDDRRKKQHIGKIKPTSETMLFSIDVGNNETASVSVTINSELKQLGYDHGENVKLEPRALEFFEYLQWFAARVLGQN